MGIFDRLVTRMQSSRPSRQSTRVSVDLRVDVRTTDRQLHSVYLENLAPGGARISTPMKFAKGTRLTLIFSPETGHKIEAPCSVVSVQPRPGELHVDYGLKFSALRTGDALALKAFLSQQLRTRETAAPAFSVRRG